MLHTAKRLDGIGEYYFSQKLREIEVLNRQGKNIINLGIGSPDMPPHADVIKVLQEESAKSSTHAYQNYKGVAQLRKAIADWYKQWYNVELDIDTEILPLIGSKEGIMHVCMTYLNEGDKALVPNPGYPTYRSAVKLAGGVCIDYELKENNNYFPDFTALEQTDLLQVKLMWVNYPQMPSGQLPTVELFKKLIAFGRRHNILICHDNPYSFILNDKPMSILSINGAKDVAVELNSLSKSHNMAGWRVGMLCGSKQNIDNVLRFKSNMDSGMFLPVQLAAAKALSLSKNWFDELNNIYRQRRNEVYKLLDALECTYSKQQAGLFVWAKVSESYTPFYPPSSGESEAAGLGYTLSDDVLYNANVFITPGGIFGNAGNDYVRVSLCSSIEKFKEAAQRIQLIKNTANV